MVFRISRLRVVFLAIIFPVLAGCGGGGGNSGDLLATDNVVSTQESEPASSFEADIEPIMQAKCLGCHNDGDTPLAPFSLVGRDAAETFKSAILFTLESNTMPPPGTPQLTASERARLMAWSADQPYDYVPEMLRISLIEATAWATQPKNRDSFLSYRPNQVSCDEGEGWLVEGDELEVRTEFCNYLSVSQNSLLELAAGTEIELALSHS
ncbi:MAG: cytochrome c, partial [Halioglobus sp.]|nr:cytochrome c [Halioglobus sp.]